MVAPGPSSSVQTRHCPPKSPTESLEAVGESFNSSDSGSHEAEARYEEDLLLTGLQRCEVTKDPIDRIPRRESCSLSSWCLAERPNRRTSVTAIGRELHLNCRCLLVERSSYRWNSTSHEDMGLTVNSWGRIGSKGGIGSLRGLIRSKSLMDIFSCWKVKPKSHQNSFYR